jgi:hypothetical protein
VSFAEKVCQALFRTVLEMPLVYASPQDIIVPHMVLLQYSDQSIHAESMIYRPGHCRRVIFAREKS